MTKTIISVHKQIVVDALEAQIAIQRRKLNKEKNLLIAELLEKDIAELQNAINTATEGK